MLTGSGTGIGRNTAVAAEANHLMLLGVDMDVREGAITDFDLRGLSQSISAEKGERNPFLYGQHWL